MDAEIKIRVITTDEPVTIELNALGEVTITQGLNGRYSAVYGLTLDDLETIARTLRAKKEAA